MEKPNPLMKGKPIIPPTQRLGICMVLGKLFKNPTQKDTLSTNMPSFPSLPARDKLTCSQIDTYWQQTCKSGTLQALFEGSWQQEGFLDLQRVFKCLRFSSWHHRRGNCIFENEGDKWPVKMENFPKARFHLDCVANPEKSHFGLMLLPWVHSWVSGFGTKVQRHLTQLSCEKKEFVICEYLSAFIVTSLFFFPSKAFLFF